MLNLVDVVNWNADASCLAAGRWLGALEGGADSEFCRWLGLYLEFNRPVCLGLTGPTIADLHELNPEALILLRSNPQIFSFIRRPFAHDIGLLRTAEGLALNLDYGARTLRLALGCCPDVYLAPEFMCNAMQISALSAAGIQGTFIHPSRFEAAVSAALPTAPYRVRGLFDDSLTCIPFHGPATETYLDAIHHLDATRWNECLRSAQQSTIFSWRDGESAFLLPDSLLRERTWLLQEDSQVKRVGWSEVEFFTSSIEDAKPYPIHPFSAWIREMKTYWYLADLRDVERDLSTLPLQHRHLWLLAINSDILSSIEKRSPQIRLLRPHGETELFDIHRQEKCTEGEECLALIRGMSGDVGAMSRPAQKLRDSRLRFLRRLDGLPA